MSTLVTGQYTKIFQEAYQQAVYRAFQVDEWAMGFMIGLTHPRGSRGRGTNPQGRVNRFIFTLSGSGRFSSTLPSHSRYPQHLTGPSEYEGKEKSTSYGLCTPQAGIEGPSALPPFCRLDPTTGGGTNTSCSHSLQGSYQYYKQNQGRLHLSGRPVPTFGPRASPHPAR